MPPRATRTFKVESARKCVDAAREVYRLHGTINRLRAIYPPEEDGFPPEVRQQAYEFIDQVFQHQPRS